MKSSDDLERHKHDTKIHATVAPILGVFSLAMWALTGHWLNRAGLLEPPLKSRADNTVPKLSVRSELASAFRYMLARWLALNRCFEDGRLALDNNPAERALRGGAIGRKNYHSPAPTAAVSAWPPCTR